MGTYTNIYFENEKFSIDTKYLYPSDVIKEYQKNKKIYFGYKHNNKFDRCSYNFFYNTDKNTLKIAVANDFYLHLHDVSNFDGDIDVFYSQKSRLLENKHFEYKGLLITDIKHFEYNGVLMSTNINDNRIGFIYNDIQYRVWFQNNVIVDIVVTDNIKDSENTFRTMDFNISSYFTGKEIYEISKNDKTGIDFFKFILEKKEILLARKIVNAYENDIKQHIDILQEFLLNYKPKERIILDMID